MMTVQLTEERGALVDDEDHEELSKHEWRACRCHSDPRHEIWVAMRWRASAEEPVTTLMHRQVLGLAPNDGRCVVHLNGDRLDNRKENLLAADWAAVQRGRRFGIGRSPFKGVAWDARLVSWRAHATIGGKKRHLGYFADEVFAALAYDRALREADVVPLVLNFPDIDDYGHVPRWAPSSKYVGVTWSKAARKWQAYAKIGGRQLHLGLYESETEAARARDAAAIVHLGTAVEMNFPLAKPERSRLLAVRRSLGLAADCARRAPAPASAPDAVE